MLKNLWIAEKPNVAGDIAHVLGVPKSGSDYENDENIVTYCFGHLLGLVMPQGNFPLPILPEEYPLYPTPATKDRYKHIVHLLNRKDVGLVINATDCAREGEAIFRYIYDSSGCKKPRKRLWLNSTDEESYRKAMNNLLDGKEKDNLFEAAFCRNKADFLTGLNGSRASGFATGRVMTPTLFFVVDAWRKNKYFIPQDYHELEAHFNVSQGMYSSRLYEKDGSKIRKFDSKQSVQEFIAATDWSLPCDVKDESKPSFSQAPLLFDMNEAQKIIYKKLKIKAEESEAILQSLYDEYKALSYPRSDFNALPENFSKDITERIAALNSVAEYGEYATAILENGWINTRDKRVFDNSRVDDHYALIPTGKIRPNPNEKKEISIAEVGGQLSSILPAKHYAIFDLITRRTLAIFFPKAEYALSSRITTHPQGHIFKTNGKVLKNPGWLTVYGENDDDDEENSKKGKKDKAASLVNILPGEQAKLNKWEQHDLQTKAPPLLNDATLLEAMKNAGKRIDDKELSQMIMQKGLGTSATRTGIIKKLKEESVNKTTGKKKPAQIKEEKGGYVPTDLGLAIVKFWEEAQPEMIDPILSAEWENQLDKVANGQMAPDTFMQNIEQFVTNMVSAAQYKRDEMTEELCTCPACQSSKLIGSTYSWRCRQCSFSMQKTIAKKVIPKEVLIELAEKGVYDKEISGFVSKKGTQFSARLKIVDDTEALGGKKVAFVFPESVSFALPCPVCKSEMKDKPMLLECTSCDTKIWKKVAGIVLNEQQLKKIVSGGTTETLKLQSSSGKEFKAKLQFDAAQKKVAFIFEKSKK